MMKAKDGHYDAEMAVRAQIDRMFADLENLRSDIMRISSRSRAEAEAFVTQSARLAMLVQSWNDIVFPTRVADTRKGENDG